MNLIEYIEEHGGISFRDEGLNEVDNLVFSELSYVAMDEIVGPDTGRAMTVAQMGEQYIKKTAGEERPVFNDPLPVLEKAMEAPRFKNVMCCFYRSVIDEEQHMQFAAVTFLYRSDEAYVAFRGTDDTIVGWREDFNLSFMDETPGQRLAVEYLENVARQTNGRLIVGGHSKGGNFAVYASAFCDSEIRDTRIDRIYSNDGPGFRKEITKREGYIAVRDRIVKFIPDQSIVGVLLADSEERRYIKSSAKGFSQHDPMTWCIAGTRFEEADARSPLSSFVEDTLSKWLGNQEDDKRRTLVDTFFDSTMASGAQTAGELNKKKLEAYKSFTKAMSEVDDESKSSIQQMLKDLVATGLDVIWGKKDDQSDKDDEKNDNTK